MKEEPSVALENDETLSPLLNTVRQQRGEVTLDEVLKENLVPEFAKDQYGSRYLQTKLDEAPPDTKAHVSEAIQAEAPDLAKDTFGNHVVQKIFDIGDSGQKKALVQALQGHVAKLSQDQCGCRVIQKAINAVSKESQQQIARELEEHVEECIRNMHGNHVIQKCIEQMPPDSVNFIIKAVEMKAEETARHVYGCRVIQRLLEHCASEQLKPMLEQILYNVAVLAKDAYGNYVVQHVLEHGRKEDKQRIIQTIRGQIADFSREKYSSNVVEKCFEIATVGEHADSDVIQQERAALMRTVLESPEVLLSMCTNTYGNYVASPEKWIHLEGSASELDGRTLGGGEGMNSGFHGRAPLPKGGAVVEQARREGPLENLGFQRLLQKPSVVESLYELASSPGDEYHVDGDRGRRHAGALWALPGLLTVVDFQRRVLRSAWGLGKGACTASGFAGLGAFGLLLCPYVVQRAPLEEADREALWEDLLQITAVSESDLLSFAELWAAVVELRLPPLSFHDLQRPLGFRGFELLGRFTFACYSDASGVMTLPEFTCAVHKMVDLALEVHSQAHGGRTDRVARARLVRHLSQLIAPAVFRVLDFDQSGDIGTFEFLRGALLLLCTVQGAPLDTPQLAELAFRVVDADGKGRVTHTDLARWVQLGVQEGVVEHELQLEPVGPWGIFGTRTLTPQQLARKWVREADLDRDGTLRPEEFGLLAPRLRLHRILARLCGKYTERLPTAGV
ncbi:unnamed protein product [Effrenium voratum]|nr:unnamed protein product [Effrenium voratum]